MTCKTDAMFSWKCNYVLVSMSHNKVGAWLRGVIKVVYAVLEFSSAHLQQDQE